MTIDITKPVKLRCGRPARVYTDKGMNFKYPLIGEYKDADGDWISESWTKNGYCVDEKHDSDNDLILDTAIEFTTWANVYSDDIYFHSTAEGAEAVARRGSGLLFIAIPFRIRIDGNNVTTTQIKEEE